MQSIYNIQSKMLFFKLPNVTNNGWNELNKLIRPIYFIGRCTGFLSFSFVYNKNNEIIAINFSIYDFCIATIAFSIYLMLAYFGSQILPPTQESLFEFNMTLVVLVASNSFSAINVFIGILNRNNYFQIIQFFKHFDYELTKFNTKLNYQLHRKIIYTAYLLSIFISMGLWLITFFIYPGFDFKNRFFYSLMILCCYLGPNLGCITIIYLYCFMLLSVLTRYRKLNSVLR